MNRANLSESVAEAIRERVLAGAIAPGERINEVHLSRELGVSRTPLREALTLLIGEGFLESIPRRGYFVRDLSVQEMEHLYVIRALLDPEALRLAGLPTRDQIQALRRLNGTIAEASPKNPARVIALDDQWHRLLLSHCENPVLMAMIEQHMLRTRRYEHAYLRHKQHVENAIDEHERIVAALEHGALERACAVLKANMLSAREPLLAWLRGRESKSEA